MTIPVTVEDVRPLLALIAPWFGLFGVMLAGEKRANLREIITFGAASVQAAVVLPELAPVLRQQRQPLATACFSSLLFVV